MTQAEDQQFGSNTGAAKSCVDVPSTSSQRERPKRKTITDGDAVKALFDNHQRTLLAPFFAGPISVTEAAELADALPTTMLYLVRRLVKSGILHEVDQVRRSGKLVRRYETVAREFFIPIDISNDLLVQPSRKYQQQFNEAMVEELLQHHYNVEPMGSIIRRYSNGVVAITGGVGDGYWTPGVNGPPVIFGWAVLKLSDDDAREFQMQLAELMNKFRTKPEGDRSYYAGLQFAPVPATHVQRRWMNAAPTRGQVAKENNTNVTK
jgi:hypothetical protein